MKELESSQEIILLKDAIIAAASQGLDFQKKDQAKKCAGIIRETINDVEMILSLDCHDLDSKKQAQMSMHSLIFSQTLLSSNDLDENERKYCEHACQSLPEIGWSTYLHCVQSCGWMKLATETWVQMQTRTQNRIVAKRILDTLKTIAVIPDFLDISYFIMRKHFDALRDDAEFRDESKLVMNSVIDFLVKLQKTEVEQIRVPTSCAIATIGLLSHCVQQIHCIKVEPGDDFHQRLTKMLQALVTLAIKIIKVAERDTDPELVYSLNDCYAIIQSTMMKQCHFPPLKEFWDFVKVGDVITSSDQESITMDIKSVNSRDWQCDDAIERLLIRLQGNANLPNAVECLQENYKILKKHHVSNLLAMTAMLSSSEASKIQQIVRNSFMNWTMDIQDSFRGDWHEHYGFKDFIFVDTQDISFDLIKAINLLSSVQDEDNVVAKTMSFLCLQAPMTVLMRLLDFAIQSGQRETITEIMQHLKSSVRFARNHDESVLSTCISSIILRQDLTSQALSHAYQLIQSLLKMDILQPAELVSNLLTQRLYPSQFTGRFLRIFHVTLTHDFIRAIEAVKLPVVILQLCKLLHFCMTRKWTAIQWDILDLKQQVVLTLNTILNWMKTNPNVVTEHEICWLWSKLEDLDATVFPYMLNAFVFCKLERLCIKKVQQMSQSCLLLSSLLESNKDSTILAECRLAMNTGRTAITVATVQLLPRLTSQEVQSLLQELCLCFEDPLNDYSFASLVGITVLLDSLAILSKFGLCLLPEYHVNAIVQASITSIKVALLPQQPLSTGTLAMLICVMGHMAVDMGNAFGSAARILLLDLLTQVQNENAEEYSSVVLHAIEGLEDENLVAQAKKIFKRSCSETEISTVDKEESCLKPEHG